MNRSWTVCATVLASRQVTDPLRVVLRERARMDIEEAVDWYRDNAEVDNAVGFLDAVQAGAPASRSSARLRLPPLRR